MKNIIAVIFLFTFYVAHSQNINIAHSSITGSTHSFTDTTLVKANFTSAEAGIANAKSFSVKPFSSQCNIKSWIVPATFITYGIVALNNHAIRNLDRTTSRTIKNGNINFKNNADNYLQYAPVLAVYGLNTIGIKGKNNFVDRTIMFSVSTLVTASIVCAIKPMSGIKRPDNSAANSFPSGHTTTAFAAAEFLHQEYKHRSPLYSILGYAAATTTGILRMYNNKHYLSDVVAGAGFGMLSTKLVYWVYPVIKRKIGGRKSLLASHTTGAL